MSEQFTNGYALLISVDENNIANWALPDVVKDVKALEKVLTHKERCAYPPDNVKVLMGKEATRQGILDGLEWLQERIAADKSDDATVVIYYTGHGWRDESVEPPDFYFIPYDIKEGRERARALRATDFAGEVSALKPERLLVVLDCCHAAGMGVKGSSPLPSDYISAAVAPSLLMEEGEVSVGPAAKGAKGIEELTQGKGRAVLSSSTGEQSSWIRKDRQMSVFTYHLIEALTGHAEPEEGAKEVLVSDVMGHVYRHVPRSVAADWGAEQTPDYQVSGNFPIALLLGGKGLSKGQPAPDPLEMPAVEALPSHQATVTGSGAVAQGERAAAAGAGGVAVSGNVEGGIHVVQGEEIHGNVDKRTIHTDGGAYIGGGVNAGGDIVGRDKVIQGDEVHGDKVVGDKVGGDKTEVGDISGSTGVAIGNGAQAIVTTGVGGENVRIDHATIYQGPVTLQTSTGQSVEPTKPLIEETIRLDVAAPQAAMLDEPFDLAVAVRQPDAPLLTVEDLTEVTSEEGSIFRTEEAEIVKYRIEVTGSWCEIVPQHYVVKLRPRENSRPCFFKVTARRPGTHSLFISAYQEDESLAAQTRVRIEISVPVQGAAITQ